ncbi:hypothetical protein [Mucilaginibacter gilvus]|uniref:Uncharacterized protein n=1 Tax=Mucilaginibacter gilvus TaxID=2305909 RepID=A0A444MP03_9SPHI|nr:hypothetical protein [Mucilaginibacter gilvus]RWY52307.1 hypothetical protein EPL05_10355 [Mucilaginibacter gilvus]
MRALKLAPTISTPELRDVPQTQDVLDMLERRKSANIVEGYKISGRTDPNDLFSFFSEINIDNEKLWSLVKALIIDFPEEVALIYQYIDDEEPKYGEYVDKFSLINYLENYEKEVVQDGFLHFGIINNTETELQEVFVHRTKYIQYWGIDEVKFEETMKGFELYRKENLNFIDEYPVQTKVLSVINPEVTNTQDLLDLFESRYGNEQLL